MKLLCWNINGIRAIERKGIWPTVLNYDADIICLQETKAEKSQLSEALTQPAGYQTVEFWSSKERKGYSGTAVYTKEVARETRFGLHLPDGDDVDRHGRLITTILDEVIVVAGYFPNGKSKTASLPYKKAFYEALFAYLPELEAEFPNKPLLVVGDLNIAHTEIDIARPKANAKTIGFLPEERALLDDLRDELGFVDIWRHHNTTTVDVYSYWDMKSGARDRNVGWRIDYAWGNAAALQLVKNIYYDTDVMGSDHCPLVVEW